MPAIDRMLSALLATTPILARHGESPPRPISQVDQDSRGVLPDACFVAVPGFRVDGHTFLPQARAAGATTMVVQRDRRPFWEWMRHEPGICLVEVADSRAALADLAAAFHGFPARDLTVVGVTGTDGKSTTCYLITSILGAAGFQTGMIGGVQFKVGDVWRMNTITQTSPEAPQVQALLAEMRDASLTHAVVEATSHGLELHRLDHCDFDIAVFTGLSDDHLDFHGTREAYLAAKLRLFGMLDTATKKGVPRRGVIHANDPGAPSVTAATAAPFIHVGFAAPAGVTTEAAAPDTPALDVTASDLVLRADGSDFRVITAAGALNAHLHLPGRFNLHNALLAAGAARALDLGPVPIAAGLDACAGVPGRMQRIDAGQPFAVLVDAAATTDALRTVLEALRPLVRGRLIVVFGCAGERDPGRRSGMGQAAAAFADFSVLTSENPRSEDPAAIVREIALAMEAAGSRSGAQFEEEADRRAAIDRAFGLAAPDDLVLIAGKGAEQTMIFADRTEPWDDRVVARELLAGRTPS